MTPRQAADQRECPHSSTDTGPIELSGHNPRSEPSRGQAGCGLVSLFRRRDDPGAGAIVRLFCKRRRCPDCGPRRCARLKARYLELLRGYLHDNPAQALVWFVVAPGAWATLARRLRRHHAPYLRIPAAAGDLVITIAGVPLDRADIHQVPDVAHLLEQAFTWDEASGFDTRRPSDRGWEAGPSGPPTEVKAAGSGATPGPSGPERAGWELIGFIGHPYFTAIEFADQLDLTPAPIPERELADDWAEAHTIRLPGEGTATWNRVMYRLAVRPPTTRQQDRDLREHRRRLIAGRRSVQDRLPGIAA
jgi:hypothetical protein